MTIYKCERCGYESNKYELECSGCKPSNSMEVLFKNKRDNNKNLLGY